jgi:hypothetical protein
MKRFLNVVVLACLPTWALALPTFYDPGFTSDRAFQFTVENVPLASGQGPADATQTLNLVDRTRNARLLLLEGVHTLCSVYTAWTDDRHLDLNLPEGAAQGCHVQDREIWHGVTIRVRFHRQLVSADVPSPDGKYRIVILKQCETEAWGVYLRKKGEPDYTADTGKGWGDPTFFGGFPVYQPWIKVVWSDPKSATIQVAYRSNGTTLKSDIGDVHLDWSFDTHYSAHSAKFEK